MKKKRGMVEDYLTKVARMVSGMHTRGINGYSCMDDFVLRNGAPMLRCPRRQWPRYMSQGDPGCCYRNAAVLALADEDLIYCEGYALGIIPLMHAWVIDAQGRVIDNTWKRPGTDYYGVAISTEYLRKQILKLETYGLIDRPVENWPLLRAPVKAWKHPIMEKL